MSAFAGFCNFSGAYPAFSCALFGASAEEKIPAIVMVALTSIIQILVFGKEAFARFIFFVILFAIFKSVSKKKDQNEFEKNKSIIIRTTISSVVTEVLLILLSMTPITEIAHSIVHIIVTAVFTILFIRTIKYFSSISEGSEEEITTINNISAVLAITAITACLNPIMIFGVNLWIIVCVALVMLYSWKNKLLKAVICALLSSLMIAFCGQINLEIVICIIVTSIVTALISRANKKGALIGLIIATVIAVVLQFKSAPEMPPEMSFKLTDEYKEFLRSAEARYTVKSGDEYNKIIEELKNVEELEKLKYEAQNTYSSRVIKSMIVGFLLLIFIPEVLLEKLKIHEEIKDEFTQFKERLLKIHKVYRLNAGEETDSNNVEEKAQAQSTKKSQKKKY